MSNTDKVYIQSSAPVRQETHQVLQAGLSFHLLDSLELDLFVLDVGVGLLDLAAGLGEGPNHDVLAFVVADLEFLCDQVALYFLGPAAGPCYCGVVDEKLQLRVVFVFLVFLHNCLLYLNAHALPILHLKCPQHAHKLILGGDQLGLGTRATDQIVDSGRV